MTDQEKKSRIIKHYKVYSGAVGVGSFARVYYGFDTKLQRDVAIKYIRAEKLALLTMKRVHQEIQLMNAIEKHINIASLYDWIYDDATKSLYLVFEYCNFGTLAALVRQRKYLAEAEILHYMKQIKQALQHLHDKGIMHRDLKLSNILLHHNKNMPFHGTYNYYKFEDLNLKLSDFDFAKYNNVGGELECEDSEDLMKQTVCGTPICWAPETVHSAGTQIASNSELWSLGLMLYEMIYGVLPFSKAASKNLVTLSHQLKEGLTLERPHCHSLSHNIMDLLIGLLEVDPDDRFTWNEFFNHPFFFVSSNAKEEEENIRQELQQISSSDDSENEPTHKTTSFNSPLGDRVKRKLSQLKSNPNNNNNSLSSSAENLNAATIAITQKHSSKPLEVLNSVIIDHYCDLRQQTIHKLPVSSLPITIQSSVPSYRVAEEEEKLPFSFSSSSSPPSFDPKSSPFGTPISTFNPSKQFSVTTSSYMNNSNNDFSSTATTALSMISSTTSTAVSHLSAGVHKFFGAIDSKIKSYTD